MRKRKTVLVLGAGASKNFGFPLGIELRNQIARDLDIRYDDFGQRPISGSYEIVQALEVLNRTESGRIGDINPHRSAAVRISRAMPLSGSIDELVERLSDDKLLSECAKLAIGKAILEAERKSTLYVDRRKIEEEFPFSASDSWLAFLFRDLTRGVGIADLDKAFENVFIINFNYDRCVEHFLYMWLRQIYPLTEQSTAEICAKLRVVHPYGSLGKLPFQSPNSSVPFGGEFNGPRLVEIASRIRTYSETTEDEPELLTEAKYELSCAERVVFLGFAFHEQNMKLLQVDEACKRSSLNCFASTLGVSRPRLSLDKRGICEAMRLNSDSGLFFDEHNGDCEQFWREFGDVVVN